MSINNENPSEVSEYLIKSFRSVIDSKNKSKKATETVIAMIASNLTYDDPGMFIKSLVCNERDRQIQDATVIWLINQMIWMSNEPQFMSHRYI